MSNKYMKNLTFANIAKACEGTYIGDETQLDTTITGAVIDLSLIHISEPTRH